ncbi:MAG: DUF4261 domain-containing protein [Solirubrobacteraceae bacterium]|nr:DUF4261 domain-containing protein [Solirubrobacteraceae bacterium]
MYVAFLLLPEAIRPDPDAIAAAYEALFPDRPPIVATADDVLGIDGGTVSLTGEDGVLHAMLVDSPVPDGEAERNTARSLAFVGQEPTLPPHGAHLVLPWNPIEELTIVEGLRAQARVTAAAALATGAIAVYVGAAGATHPADWYVEVVRQVDDPTMLWIGVSHAVLDQEPPRHSFLSFGMHQFGQPDLLLTAGIEDGSDAIEYFYDLLAYCSASGKTVGDGETVGRTEDERILVRHEPNPVDEDRAVFCVDL